jgi:dTDP-4-amino-4,6-dideoxygalactose transaminase
LRRVPGRWLCTIQCGARTSAPGDEVITPALTFVSKGFTVAYTQAVPVLVDIDPVARCIDPSSVEAAITRRTKAIIAVHMHGLMADMNASMSWRSGMDWQ